MKLTSVKDAIIIVLTIALLSISTVLLPLLLGYFISILMSSEPRKDYLLYGCMLGLFITSVIRALCMHQFDYRCELLGIRISCALKGLIYSKVSTNSVKLKRRQRGRAWREEGELPYKKDEVL